MSDDEHKIARVHGFQVRYDDRTYDGVKHLCDDLQHAEARVFFEHARRHEEAEFEDDYDRQFTLVYEGRQIYSLKRR